jgi:putative hydrolase of the HAD superfamily
LLDMDDTILEDTVSTAACWLGACEQFAAEIAPLTARQLVTEIDALRTWYWGDPERHRAGRLNLDRARGEIVAMALQRHGVATAALGDRIALCHAELRDHAMKPFDGALETLRHLRERGLRLALLTNGASLPQRRKIERFGLAPFFDCIVVEGEFGAGKPDERVYRHALAALKAAPAETWMAGDNLEWDVAAPQRLGIHGVWVDFAGAGLPVSSAARPDRIIRSLSELVPLLFAGAVWMA